MALQDTLIAASAAAPARLEPQKDGTLTLDATLAERKAFLSKKKLTYKCRVRVDESARSVRFWEMLVEKGSGLSSGATGLDGDMSPGIGFKKETYKSGGKEREGTIEEASRLFGKDYHYSWDYAALRAALRAAAEAEGYRFEVVLREKSVY
jgi:hypothetical protein